MTEMIPWRIRSRQSAKDLWDYNSPVSQVTPAELQQATAKFELNRDIFESNSKLISDNDKIISDYDDLINSSKDTIEIRRLSTERNKVIRENSTLEPQTSLAKQNMEEGLAVMHRHRKEIGDFYLDGPHTTEFKALVGWPAVVAVGGLAYFAYSKRKKLKRGMNTLYYKSPISGAFRYA